VYLPLFRADSSRRAEIDDDLWLVVTRSSAPRAWVADSVDLAAEIGDHIDERLPTAVNRDAARFIPGSVRVIEPARRQRQLQSCSTGTTARLVLLQRPGQRDERVGLLGGQRAPALHIDQQDIGVDE
jgi:hypothetical protein